MAKRLARSSQPWAKGPSPHLNASSAARSACSTAAPNSPCAELGMSMCESLVVIRFGASVLEEAPSVELSPSRMMGPFHDLHAGRGMSFGSRACVAGTVPPLALARLCK